MGTLEVHEEKRFAVVMYGGVSLAIYINGVTQELLQLVRATADPAAGPTTGTAKVYREIAELLKARFVIDILSGTSAGGINAVFLAKALANDQSMDMLERMWLDEGDIDVLINDKRSALEHLKTGFAAPRSLLNSRRMYRKLVEAFNLMDGESRPAIPPPAAEPPSPAAAREIDLFVTATDLQGMRTPVSLSDQVVYEYRHRHVFHFRKSPEDNLNDFEKADNRFLAFACRSTSSFPFAFEPMSLADAETAGAEAKKWERHYRDYLLDAGLVEQRVKDAHPELQPNAEGRFDVFTRRAFADGGYLDNKPFSYAVQAIAARRSDVPVDRKLLYVEPSPESVRDELTILDPPNAFENIVKVFSLAQYETIREDLQQLRARNRLIERVGRILDGTLQDIQGSDAKSDPQSVNFWLRDDLKQMIVREGVAYGGYLRLRVSRLTDDLAEVLTRQAGFEVGSDVFRAVHEFVRAWRDHHYYYYAGLDEKRKNFNQFLKDFNLRFFVHRLRFTIANIDRMYRLADDKAIWTSPAVNAAPNRDSPQDVIDRVRHEGPEAVKAFKDRLRRVRGELSQRLEEIYTLRRRLMVPEKDSPLTRAVLGMGLNAHEIVKEVLGRAAEAPASRAAEAVRERFRDHFADIAAIIKDIVQRADLHSDLCKTVLNLGWLERADGSAAAPGDLARELERHLTGPGGLPPPGIVFRPNPEEPAQKAPASPEAAATWAAAYYFRRFPHYDIVAFPMLQAYDIGEELDPVEIIRISPEDAQSLSRAGARKLGGSTLMHFGAFLDRTWRKNDILWGRLDGAERLISSLLTGTAHRDRIAEFTAKAHTAIFEEAFLGGTAGANPAAARGQGREMLDLLASSLLGKDPRARAAARAKMAGRIGEKKLAEILDGVIKGNLDLACVQGLFKDYEVDRRIEPRSALQSIARSVQVVGRMLGGISQELSTAGTGKRAAAWITRLGRLLWGLVEVATPHSLQKLIFKYWMALALLVAIVMVVFGGFFKEGEAAQRLGLRLMFVVAMVYSVWSLFQSILLRQFRRVGAVVRAIASVIVFAFLALAVVGMAYLGEAPRDFWNWLGKLVGG
jgi:patatin-related protein